MLSYNTHTDAHLLELFQNGDDAAYTAIYNRFAEPLIGFASAKLYSLEDARDLIHDLFTKLWTERETLVVKESLKAYLFASARYMIIDKIRKNVVRESYAEYLRLASPAFQSLEAELDARELEASIRARLSELPPKTQYIYQQNKNECRSIKEIADELHLSNQTIKNQLSAALKHIRRSISSFFMLF